MNAILLVFSLAGSMSPVSAATSPANMQHAAASYTVLSQFKVAGRQLVQALPGGKLKVEYSYRDNGRGPDLFEEIALGASGQMESFVATGKSTYGAPIEESFSRDGGNARWRSKADQGEKPNVPSAVYVPIESSVEALAIITRALLRAPDRKLAALPDGRLSAEKLTEVTVATKGKKARVALYAVNGIGTSPSYVWLRVDSASRGKLFAQVAPAFSVVESGWEDSCDELLKRQIDAEGKTLQRIAEKLSHRADATIVIRNVRWFDSEKATMNGPSDVHLFRGRIAAIVPALSPLTDAAAVIDGTGKTLLPGLFDMHVHNGAWDALLHIAGGVTTVRDMGSDNGFLQGLMTRIDAGLSIGPRIVAAGYIEGESPHSSNGGFLIKDVDGGKKAIDWYTQHGYRQIKLYNSIRPEWVEPLAAHAHQRGLRVSGHIPAFMRAEEAVRAGFDEIQHINQVMLNFLVKKDDDTRTLLRFYLVGDKTHLLDLDSPAIRDFIRLLVERNVAIDPTMATFEPMYKQRQGAPNPSFSMVSSHVPPAISRNWLTNSMDVTDQNAEPFRQSYEKMLGMVKRMYDAGVPILAGSDDIAAFTLHRELELYVTAGLSPAQTLQIATWNGARFSRVLERTGSIAVGKDADLILVDGDPVARISDVRNVSMTMKSGVMYFPAEIFEALGVKPFAPAPAVKMHKAAASH